MDEVLEMYFLLLVKVYGFGEKRLCCLFVNLGEVYMVFMVYELVLCLFVVWYDDIFGVIVLVIVSNEVDVL